MEQNTINNQKLKQAYLFFAAFIIAILFGIFINYSGAIFTSLPETAGDSIINIFSQQPEFAGNLKLTGIQKIFFWNFDESFLLKALILAGITLLILLISGVKKIFLGLVIACLICFHPFLLTLFKIETNFCSLPLILLVLLVLFIILRKPLVKKISKLVKNSIIRGFIWIIAILMFLGFIVLNFVSEPAFLSSELIVVYFLAILILARLMRNVSWQKQLSFSLVGLFLACFFLISTLVQSSSWSSQQKFFENLKANKDYELYASAELAFIHYKNALETANMAQFNREQSLFNSLVSPILNESAVDKLSLQRIDQKLLAKATIFLDIQKLNRLTDFELQRRGFDIPETSEFNRITDKKFNESIFDLHTETTGKLLGFLNAELIDRDNSQQFILALSMLPHNSKSFEYMDELFKRLFIRMQFSTNPYSALLKKEPKKNPDFIKSVYLPFNNQEDFEFILIETLKSFEESLEKQNVYKPYFTFTQFLAEYTNLKLPLKKSVKYLNFVNWDVSDAIITAKLLLLAKNNPEFNNNIFADLTDDKNEIKIFEENLNIITKGLVLYSGQELSPYLKAQVLLHLGMLLQFCDDNPAEAIQVYENLNKLNKHGTGFKEPQIFAQTNFLISRCMHKLQRWEEALEFAELAVKNDKTHLAAKFIRGKLRYRFASHALNEVIKKFTEEYRAFPAEDQKPTVESYKYIPIWELERAFYKNSVYKQTIEDATLKMRAAFEVDKENSELRQETADLLFYRGYGQRTLNVDLAELYLRESYNILNENKTDILGAKINDVLGHFYAQVWSDYLKVEDLSKEDQEATADLLVRALALSEAVRDDLYKFVTNFIEEYPDFPDEKLLPFYLIAKGVYPKWSMAHRWLSEYYKKTGQEKKCEEEFIALLDSTKDNSEWPLLNLEFGQTYLRWGSYKIELIRQNKVEQIKIKGLLNEILVNFANSEKYLDVFIRFGNSPALGWQSKAILYQRWAGLLKVAQDEKNWQEKLAQAIAAFELVLSPEIDDINNKVLANLYMERAFYNWQKEQLKWIEDYEAYEKDNDLTIIQEDFENYTKWVEKTSVWVENTINLMKAIMFYKQGESEQAFTVFKDGYSKIKSPFTAFWLGRILKKQEKFTQARKWFLIAAEKFEQSFFEIAEMLMQDSNKSGLASMFFEIFVQLTENFKEKAEYKKLYLKAKTLIAQIGEVEISNPQELQAIIFEFEEIYKSQANPAIALWLAKFSVKLNKFDAAVSWLFAASNSDGLFVQALFDAGEVLYKKAEKLYLGKQIFLALKTASKYLKASEKSLKIFEKTEKYLLELLKITEAEKTEDIQTALVWAKTEYQKSNNPVCALIAARLSKKLDNVNDAESWYQLCEQSSILVLPALIEKADLWTDQPEKEHKAFQTFATFVQLTKNITQESSIFNVVDSIRKKYETILVKYNKWFTDAEKELALKNYVNALKLYKKCYRFDDSTKSAFLIGKTYRKIGEFDEAESWFMAASNQEPVIIQALYEIGEMFYNIAQKRWRSLSAFKRFIGLSKQVINNKEIQELRIKAHEYATQLEKLNAQNLEKGKKAYSDKEFSTAESYFTQSYMIVEDAKTANLIAICMRKQQKFEGAEKWYVISAELKPGILEAYFDVAEMYFLETDEFNFAQQYFSRFLEVTQKVDKSEVKKLRSKAKDYIAQIKVTQNKDLIDGEKAFKAGKYKVAHELLKKAFKAGENLKAALLLGKTCVKLEKYLEAQTWLLVAGEQYSEAIYELGNAWYNVKDEKIRWLAEKYLQAYLNMSYPEKAKENVKKIREMAEKQILQIKKDFEAFIEKALAIKVYSVKSDVQFFNAYFEIAQFWYSDDEKRWASDLYFRIYLLLTDVYKDVEIFAANRVRADKYTKLLDEEYTKSIEKAYEDAKNENIDDAISNFIKAFKIKPNFPSDYTNLFQLLEKDKRFEELIYWSDRAVKFFQHEKSSFVKKFYEEYFFVNAKVYFQHKSQEIGKQKLEEYKKLWENGVYSKEADELLNSIEK